MSERGPDPKEVRASLVDSGWSVAPPPVQPIVVIPPATATEAAPAEAVASPGTAPPEAATPAATMPVAPTDPETRRLPTYEELAQPVVTAIDSELQDRLRAMQSAE